MSPASAVLHLIFPFSSPHLAQHLCHTTEGTPVTVLPSAMSPRVLGPTPPPLLPQGWPQPQREVPALLLQLWFSARMRFHNQFFSQFKDGLLPRRAATPSFRTWLAFSYLHMGSCGQQVSQICWQIQLKTQPEKK